MLYSNFHFLAFEGGGGAKNELNARPSLLSLPMTVSVLSQDLSGHFVVVVVGGIVVVPKLKYKNEFLE